MNNLMRKKIILSLLDSEPKSANEIADEIDESLAAIQERLKALVSENICKKVNHDDVDQYIIRKDIEAFAQLVREFLSDKEEHKDQITQFITSEYYHTRIDDGLVEYFLKRFYLDSLYQTDEEKEWILRMLHVSPSILLFAFHGNTTSFGESWNHLNQLSSSKENRDRIIRLLRSGFETPLLKMLIDDLNDSAYISLYFKLQIRAVKEHYQISLATFDEKYIEAIGGRTFAICQGSENLEEELHPGRYVSLVNPMDLSDYGLAALNLGEFELAHRDFNDALDAVHEPIEKAKVLNNKGLAFFRAGQYQKAIECIKEGIAFDSDNEIPELQANKQLAEEYLAIATDADNLTEPIQIRFIHQQIVPFDETRFCEFKEIKGNNPSNPISKDSDEYAVAYLNREGGRIFWGVRDSDRITVGVKLDDGQRDRVRRIVSEKLGAIQPSIVGYWQLELHPVYDLQSEIIENLWVIELLVSPPQRKDIYYTGSGALYVKTEGGKKKLIGPAVTEFIRTYFQNDAETE